MQTKRQKESLRHRVLNRSFHGAKCCICLTFWQLRMCISKNILIWTKPIFTFSFYPSGVKETRIAIVARIPPPGDHYQFQVYSQRLFATPQTGKSLYSPKWVNEEVGIACKLGVVGCGWIAKTEDSSSLLNMVKSCCICMVKR